MFSYIHPAPLLRVSDQPLKTRGGEQWPVAATSEMRRLAPRRSKPRRVPACRTARRGPL